MGLGKGLLWLVSGVGTETKYCVFGLRKRVSCFSAEGWEGIGFQAGRRWAGCMLVPKVWEASAHQTEFNI